jgi:hypothetical protein
MTLHLALLAILASAATQDAASALKKLSSKDPDEADQARQELLRTGPSALVPLREAAAQSTDAEFRKRAGEIADRLETRRAAAGLAKAWGDRWFAVFVKGLKIGWVHMETQEKEGSLRAVDELYLKENKDKELSIWATLRAQANEYLSPLEITVEAKGTEANHSIQGKVKENRLVLTVGDQKQAVKLRPNAITDLGVMRLVTILPRTPEYELSVIETIKIKLVESATLRFDKDESIEWGGRKVKTRRFVLSDGEGEDKVYWVDSENRLLRMQVKDDIEVILSDEKSAKDIDTKD